MTDSMMVVSICFLGSLLRAWAEDHQELTWFLRLEFSRIT